MAQYYDDGGAIDTEEDLSGVTPPVNDTSPVNDDSTGVDDAAQAQQQAPAPSPGSPSGPGGPGNPMNVPANMKRIVSYIMGADASHPDSIDQIGAQIDPEGKLSPADRNLMAIAHVRDQGGDQAAWPLMQANRVAYNAQTAFAKTALSGTPQKPADLSAAIDAANKAQANVLDGSNVQFAPSQGGVTATVTEPGGAPKQIPLNVQQFSQFLDVGGDGQWDKIMDHSAAATLARLSQVGVVTRGQSAGQLRGNAPRPQASPQAPQPGAPEQVSDQQDQNDTNAGPPVRQAPPSAAVRTGRPQAMDVTAGDQPALPGSHDAQGRPISPRAPEQDTNYGPELEARSRKIFPGVSQEDQRQQWMAAQEEKELERGNKIEVAGEKGKRALDVARATGQSRENVAQATSQGRVQASQNYSGAKIQAAQIAADARRAQAGDHDAQQRIESARKTIATKRMTGTALTPDEEAAEKMMVQRSSPQAQQGSRPAPAQSAPAPQAAPNPGAPPVQGAKFYKGQWYTRGPNGESVPVQQ